jgi:hypothetical protein
MTFGENRVFSIADELELGLDVINAIEKQDEEERRRRIAESAADLAIRAA